MPSEVVPAPKNLQFSEVTQNSFRVSWEHGAPDVALYRLSWSKRGENDHQYVSVLIFNSIPAFVRQILIPLRALGLKKCGWRRTPNLRYLLRLYLCAFASSVAYQKWTSSSWINEA